jgi:hypothetical protein
MCGHGFQLGPIPRVTVLAGCQQQAFASEKVVLEQIISCCPAIILHTVYKCLEGPGLYVRSMWGEGLLFIVLWLHHVQVCLTTLFC